jgi:hypothetical protein
MVPIFLYNQETVLFPRSFHQALSEIAKGQTMFVMARWMCRQLSVPIKRK